jgi:hypothetical protein
MKIIVKEFETTPTIKVVIEQLARIEKFAEEVDGLVVLTTLDIEIEINVPSPEEEEKKA